ncbi:MAG: hypothetical protein RIQ89_71 [Bacteroidota bacterium]|jgi:hypothetical protein
MKGRLIKVIAQLRAGERIAIQDLSIGFYTITFVRANTKARLRQKWVEL